MGSRCSHPHSDRVPERFRSHLKSVPFGETRTLAVLFSRLPSNLRDTIEIPNLRRDGQQAITAGEEEARDVMARDD